MVVNIPVNRPLKEQVQLLNEIITFKFLILNKKWYLLLYTVLTVHIPFFAALLA